MVALPAHLVATPVLERVDGGLHGVVLGAGATAAWVDLDGFVVAVTTREVPLLPNAIALAAGSGALVRPGVGAGSTARFAPGRVDLGGIRVTWDPSTPPVWDPTVPIPATAPPQAMARRGAALLHALGSRHNLSPPGPVDSPEHAPVPSATLPLRGPEQPRAAWSRAQEPTWEPTREPSREPTREWAQDPAQQLVRDLAEAGLPTASDPDGAAGLTLLFQAVRERDPVPAAAAARVLAGRGPGLTPEGDDLLAAVAGTLAVLGPATGVHGSALGALLAALDPGPGRTTALSATLLALASDRRLPEPAGQLLDLGPAGEAAWPGALARLERLGHGSGRAWAAGIAGTTVLLANPA